MPFTLNLLVGTTLGLDLIALKSMLGAADFALLEDTDGTATLSAGDALGISLEYTAIDSGLRIDGVSIEAQGAQVLSGGFAEDTVFPLDSWENTADALIEALDLFTRFRILGQNGDEQMAGASFDDVFRTRGGDDVALGFYGQDTFIMGGGNDYARGDWDNDVLQGSFGHDFLRGGEDNDRLHGGAGHDVLDGGSDTNMLTGGHGQDLFVFDTSVTGRSLVRDFTDDDLLLFTDFDLEIPQGFDADATLMGTAANGATLTAQVDQTSTLISYGSDGDSYTTFGAETGSLAAFDAFL